MVWVTWMVLALELYALVGAAFAPFFAWRGAARLDPTAHDGTWGFRLLLLPGALALWPILLVSWWRASWEPGRSA